LRKHIILGLIALFMLPTIFGNTAFADASTVVKETTLSYPSDDGRIQLTYTGEGLRDAFTVAQTGTVNIFVQKSDGSSTQVGSIVSKSPTLDQPVFARFGSSSSSLSLSMRTYESFLQLVRTNADIQFVFKDVADNVLLTTENIVFHPIKPPTNLVIKNLYKDSVTLTWTDSPKDYTNFLTTVLVRIGQRSGPITEMLVPYGQQQATLSLKDLNLTPGVTYSLQVFTYVNVPMKVAGTNGSVLFNMANATEPVVPSPTTPSKKLELRVGSNKIGNGIIWAGSKESPSLDKLEVSGYPKAVLKW